MREALIEFVSAMRELDAERVSAALEQSIKILREDALMSKPPTSTFPSEG